MFRSSVQLFKNTVLTDLFPVVCFPINENATHNPMCDTALDAHPDVEYVFRWEENAAMVQNLSGEIQSTSVVSCTSATPVAIKDDENKPSPSEMNEIRRKE